MIDFSTFKKSEYEYDYSIFGMITVNDGGVMREINVEIEPDDDDEIADSSKQALQFFADNYDKYRQIYLEAVLEYYQDRRSQLGYDSEEEEEGYPYITTVEQLLETITFTGMKIHGDMKGDKHAVGLYFDSTWDPEHGAGVLMAGFEVLDTGNQDHAYFAYALNGTNHAREF